MDNFNIDGVQTDKFDFIVVSDGSGTTYAKSCGWASQLFFRQGSRHIFHKELFGGLSNGTNNVAELAPFVFALNYIDNVVPKESKKPISVLFISDSELTVNCGNGQYARNANKFLWESIDYFARNGYLLTWHWVPRNSNEYNKQCDSLAGQIRKYLEEGP